MRELRSIAAVALASLFLASPALADVPRPQGTGCEETGLGAPCTTWSGQAGTCVEMRRRPMGRPGTDVLCLTPQEVVEAREEGWLVEREALPVPVPVTQRIQAPVLGLALGLVMALAGLAGVAFRRRRGRVVVPGA